MCLYECNVYHSQVGRDVYLVTAKSKAEAYIEVKRRLREEMPYPIEEWSILDIICAEDCAKLKRKWWQFWK